jgi:hypothetical protein
MTSPVQYDPSGEARCTYAVATSTGIPGLFNGQAPTPKESIASAGLLFVAGCKGVQLAYDQRSAFLKSFIDNSHDSWCNSIHPNSILGLLLGETSSEGHDSSFGGCIIEKHRAAHI